MKGLGQLPKTNQRFKQLVKEHQALINPVNAILVNTGSIETVEQKRKRLFNKDTGSLQLDLSGTPFWIWDEALHYNLRRMTNDHCCFVDMIGRPVNTKTGEEQPLYPYEYEFFKAMFVDSFANPGNDPRRYKHLMCKKGRGAGITDFVIYIMLYLPLCFPAAFYNSQMAIVTGIRKRTSVRIMERMKQKLYQKLGIVTDFSESVLDINGCIIEAYPAKEPDAYRGLDNLKVAFFDESDYTAKSIIDDTFANVEGFIAKNNPYIIFNSTAKQVGGLLQQLEETPDEISRYKKIYILADKMVGNIITQEELELASTSPFYRREYWGEYKGEHGNFFPQEYLDYAAGDLDELHILDTETKAVRRIIKREVGDLMVEDILSDRRWTDVGYHTAIGCDPAFSSSKFACVVFKEIEGIVYAVAERGLQAPSFEQGSELIKHLMYQEFPDRHPKVWIDSGAISVPFIRFLKEDIKERPAEYTAYPLDVRVSYMKNPMGWVVCPIPFNKYGDAMNYQFRRLLELGRFRIDKTVTPNLWTSMNSAKYDDITDKFNKKDTAKNDYYDAGRLAICNVKIGNITVL